MFWYCMFNFFPFVLLFSPVWFARHLNLNCNKYHLPMLLTHQVTSMYILSLYLGLIITSIMPSVLTVSLRWHLHFEFIISKNCIEPMKQPESPSESATWQGPSCLDVETMIWDLPIKVYATNPMYATSISLLKTEVSHAL